MNKCEICGQEMKLLFTSTYCPCEDGPTYRVFSHGQVVVTSPTFTGDVHGIQGETTDEKHAYIQKVRDRDLDKWTSLCQALATRFTDHITARIDQPVHLEALIPKHPQCRCAINCTDLDLTVSPDGDLNLLVGLTKK